MNHFKYIIYGYSFVRRNYAIECTIYSHYIPTNKYYNCSMSVTQHTPLALVRKNVKDSIGCEIDDIRFKRNLLFNPEIFFP